MALKQTIGLAFAGAAMGVCAHAQNVQFVDLQFPVVEYLLTNGKRVICSPDPAPDRVAMTETRTIVVSGPLITAAVAKGDPQLQPGLYVYPHRNTGMIAPALRYDPQTNTSSPLPPAISDDYVQKLNVTFSGCSELNAPSPAMRPEFFGAMPSGVGPITLPVAYKILPDRPYAQRPLYPGQQNYFPQGYKHPPFRFQ